MEFGIKIANQRDVGVAHAILETKLDEFLSFTPILPLPEEPGTELPE